MSNFLSVENHSHSLEKLRVHIRNYGIRFTLSMVCSRIFSQGHRLLADLTLNPVKLFKMKRLLVKNQRLHLGSGNSCVPGWINVDVYPIKGVDFVCDLQQLKKYVPGGSVEAIFISHTLEHFSKVQVRKLLSDFYSILCNGGRLWISVPNMELLYNIANDYASTASMDKVVGILMGGGRDKCDVHRCAFTSRYLSDLLKEAGFKDISYWSQPPIEFRDVPGGWAANVDGHSISLNYCATK